ncbi:unnamed protein product [Cercospora beticola]|nr:unnamed protein product [Cercospora beticola]
MTCAPLDLSSYEKRYTAKNISTLWPDYTITPGNHSDHPLDRILARSNTSTFTAYFLGESLHRRDDGMLATYYVTSGGRRALTSGSPHLEVPYMLQAHTREIDGNGTFDAIPDLTSAASDTLLVFLHNRVFFTRPVRDPLFKATRATDFPTDSVLLEGSTANVTAYVANEDSDRTVSSTAVACFSDTTYCNPALPDQPCVHSLRKKGIRSLLLTPTQQQILDRIHAPKVASMARLIKTLGAQSMLASRSIRRRNSPGLPDDQWILELGNWFSTLLFREQLLARRFATGYRNQQYNEFIVAPEPESEWMCRAQMTRSSDHSSFSVLGLAIILILGSLIIIANLTLASIVDWIRARQKNNPGGRFRTQQWKEMELLALHEKAYGHEAGIVMDTGSFTAPSGKRLTLTTVGRSSSDEYVGGRPTHSHTYGRISNATVILYPTNCGSFTEAFYNGLNEISYVLPVGNRLIPGYIGYLLAEPEARFIHTIILIHGFPDLSAGWRYQIPFFVEHGFRVIVPDCIGYGRSDAPTDSLQPYTFKSQVDDFYELCKSLGCESVIVAGHDWGSIMATHFTLWYPSFVTHLVTVAVPFFPPSKDYVPLDVLIKHMPLLGYQLQWGSAEGVVENFTKDEDGMRTFLRAAYGGLTPEGEYPFTPKNGYDLNRLPSVGDPALLDVKELDYYVQEFSRNGMRGPCNYYRTTQANFEATRPLLDRVDGGRLKVPYLFVRAMDDILVTDEWVAFMVQHVDQPVVKEVDAGHWALWEKPKEVNEVLREWLESQNFLSSGK